MSSGNLDEYEHLKRLKSIEDKDEEKLKLTGNATDIRSQTNLFDEDLTLETNALMKEIKTIGGNVNDDKLSFTCCNRKVYGFDILKTLEKLIKDIYNKNMTIDKAEIIQIESGAKLHQLGTYQARGSKYIDSKELAF